MSKTSRLEFFPINFFPIVMGLCGFTLSLKQVASFSSLPSYVVDVMAWFALVVFIVFLGFYLLKIIKFPQRVQGELDNHMVSGLFATIPISMLLIAGCFSSIHYEFARAFWIIGATGMLMVSLFIINRWIYAENVATSHVSPIWFIPVVGTILVPAAGTQFVPVEFSWLFFSVGFFFWILVFVLVLFRLVFESPLPVPMQPSLFILLAPPAVGFVSWTTLNTNLDVMGHMLYYVAVFIFLLLMVELPRFAKLKFSLGAWAYSFPLAAFTIATFKMYALSHVEFLQQFAWALQGLLTVLILWLILRTFILVLKGEICLPPPNMKKP